MVAEAIDTGDLYSLIMMTNDQVFDTRELRIASMGYGVPVMWKHFNSDDNGKEHGKVVCKSENTHIAYVASHGRIDGWHVTHKNNKLRWRETYSIDSQHGIHQKFVDGPEEQTYLRTQCNYKINKFHGFFLKTMPRTMLEYYENHEFKCSYKRKYKETEPYDFRNTKGILEFEEQDNDVTIVEALSDGTREIREVWVKK